MRTSNCRKSSQIGSGNDAIRTRAPKLLLVTKVVTQASATLVTSSICIAQANCLPQNCAVAINLLTNGAGEQRCIYTPHRIYSLSRHGSKHGTPRKMKKFVRVTPWRGGVGFKAKSLLAHSLVGCNQPFVSKLSYGMALVDSFFHITHVEMHNLRRCNTSGRCNKSGCSHQLHHENHLACPMKPCTFT